MRITRPTLFVFIAVACFVIDLLIAVNVVNGGNFDAWLAGGLASFAAAHLP